MLIAGIEDRRLRCATLCALSGTQNRLVADAAIKFVDDSDNVARLHALCCLAINQDVRAIPHIAELQAKINGNNGGAIRALDFLVFYDVPEAVPYLNRLLTDERSANTRLSATLALRARHLADRSSIPFLIQALSDPDSRGIIQDAADQMLHEIVPILGGYRGREYLLTHRSEEILMFEHWWAEEQNGKHLIQSPAATRTSE
jgi:HEAT repeat protein